MTKDAWNRFAYRCKAGYSDLQNVDIKPPAQFNARLYVDRCNHLCVLPIYT
jgi:hypothetical protein